MKSLYEFEETPLHDMPLIVHDGDYPSKSKIHYL
jgi:hypothetical protein